MAKGAAVCSGATSGVVLTASTAGFKPKGPSSTLGTTNSAKTDTSQLAQSKLYDLFFKGKQPDNLRNRCLLKSTNYFKQVQLPQLLVVLNRLLLFT